VLSVRRSVPVVTTVVCEAATAARSFAIVSEAAGAAGGLVTTEAVPAARAVGRAYRAGVSGCRPEGRRRQRGRGIE
jgi:hypothetical protein